MRVQGHTLRAEGAAYSRGSDGVRHIPGRNTTSGVGYGLCSCGAMSDILDAGTQRRAWHRAHKAAVAETVTFVTPDFFWARVRKGSGCWEWMTGRHTDGYGQLKFQGRMYKAHRVSWMLAHGSIPSGAHVLHRCDNPPCVRPSHLFLGTNQDNVNDRTAKGRYISTLTVEQVREVRQRVAQGETQAAVAQSLGVRYTTISKIVNRERWKWVA